MHNEAHYIIGHPGEAGAIRGAEGRTDDLRPVREGAGGGGENEQMRGGRQRGEGEGGEPRPARERERESKKLLLQ